MKGGYMPKYKILDRVIPTGDQVVVVRDKIEESKGGIIIPQTSQERASTGRVIATGPGRITEQGQLVPMPVKPGDRVLYGPYDGMTCTLDTVAEEEFLLMPSACIRAIIEEPK